MADNELLARLDRLHTTQLGAVRIKRNLALTAEDAVGWCRDRIQRPDARTTRTVYLRIGGMTNGEEFFRQASRFFAGILGGFQ